MENPCPTFKEGYGREGIKLEKNKGGENKKATDSQKYNVLDQLCDALLAKLVERASGQLALNQPVTGSSPVRLTSKLLLTIYP